MRRVLALSFVGLIAGAALVGCGDKKDPSATAHVVSTDSKCTVDKTELAAGHVVFTVKNEGSKVTEFYVYAAADKIEGEVENIAPGATRELTVTLKAGDYQGVCKPGMVGNGIRTKIKVTGNADIAPDAKLAAGVTTYKAYVAKEADDLLVQTQKFVDTIKAGNIEEAKRLYPIVRQPWERIEPVAESFGDLDPAIDGREGDQEPGQEFTGYHKLEQDLWVKKDISKSGATADKLMADVRVIAEKAKAVDLKPTQIANGAKELLDEVASTKMTGEEDRYSHTDLWDIKANIEGAQLVVSALRASLAERDPALLAEVDAKVEALNKTLETHRKGDGWKLHTELSKEELKTLSDAVNAAGEPISKIAGAVAK